MRGTGRCENDSQTKLIIRKLIIQQTICDLIRQLSPFFHFEGWFIPFKSMAFLSLENTIRSKLLLRFPLPSIIPRHSRVVAWDRALLITPSSFRRGNHPTWSSPHMSHHLSLLLPTLFSFWRKSTDYPLRLACSMTSNSLRRSHNPDDCDSLTPNSFYLPLNIFHNYPIRLSPGAYSIGPEVRSNRVPKGLNDCRPGENNLCLPPWIILSSPSPSQLILSTFLYPPSTALKKIPN